MRRSEYPKRAPGWVWLLVILIACALMAINVSRHRLGLSWREPGVGISPQAAASSRCTDMSQQTGGTDRDHGGLYHHNVHWSPKPTPGWDPGLLIPWQHARAAHHKRRGLLKIFIYDLPPHLQNCTDESEMWQHHLYGGEIKLPRLIAASSHVTKDPVEADYFYIPTIFFCRGTPGGPEGPAWIAREAIQHIRQMPYWDRYGGLDHIWIYTQDMGFCYSKGSDTLEDIYNSTILSHFGLMDHGRASLCDIDSVLAEFGACRDRQFGGTTRPCFTPGKDFVIPHFCFERRMDHKDYSAVRPMYTQGPNMEPLFQSGEKTTNFFFAGGTRPNTPDGLYSGGVRQTIHLLKDTPGFKFVTQEYSNVSEYILDTQRSTFCLAAAGNGFGDRVKMSILNGCIPFVIQDNIQVEYEDLLPYREFAVRIPSWLIWKLPDIVSRLVADTEKVKQMQLNIETCIWKFFMWEPPGRALEALMCELTRKLYPDTLVQLDLATCTLHCNPRPRPEGKR